MDNYQINRLCLSNPITKNVYLGCIVTNNFIFDVKKYGFSIINTNISSEGMGHWVLIVNFKNKIIFFDSFGNTPDYYGNSLSHFALKYKPEIVCTYQIQANKSLTCGVYCIYFAYYLYKNKTLKSILKPFSKRLFKNNEKIILRFYFTLTGARYDCKPIYCIERTFNIPCEHVNCDCDIPVSTSLNVGGAIRWGTNNAPL